LAFLRDNSKREVLHLIEAALSPQSNAKNLNPKPMLFGNWSGIPDIDQFPQQVKPERRTLHGGEPTDQYSDNLAYPIIGCEGWISPHQTLPKKREAIHVFGGVAHAQDTMLGRWVKGD
jgi:hypothetical protein